VLDPIVCRQVFKVEAEPVAASQDAAEREKNREWCRYVVDLAESTCELPIPYVLAIVGSIAQTEMVIVGRISVLSWWTHRYPWLARAFNAGQGDLLSVFVAGMNLWSV